MKTELYPLCFQPILKERVWGGRRLASLGKLLPGNSPYGESWELCDLPTDSSRVAEGALGGLSLGQLRLERTAELLGPVELDSGSFPILIKYIDAAEKLSVQVHPPAEVAERFGGRAKSEAWYILDADAAAKLYVGFRDGCSRQDYQAALQEGRVAEILRAVPIQAGQLLPVAPGTVHAIGAGVLLAEVQQPSDTTYRVYDWDRVGLDGKPRQLHLTEALESMRFEARPAPLAGTAEVDMQLFRIRVVELAGDATLPLEGEGPLVLVGCAGEAMVTADRAAPVSCARGSVVLVPHCCRSGTASARGLARLLAVSFPRR